MSSVNTSKDDVDVEPYGQEHKDLLSLRWNNHLLAFQSLLSHVKQQVSLYSVNHIIRTSNI